MIKSIWISFKEKSTAYKMLFIVFSIAFAKSIFISPFSLIGGVWGIALGVLICALVFSICLVLLYFISKISWKYKKTDVKKIRLLLYMLPTLILSAGLLIVFFPGIMSWDSMYIWETALKAEYSSLHPVTYVIFVHFLQNIVSSPWIVITVQFFYSAFAFALISYTFEGFGLNRKICWTVAIILALYPVHAYQNTSMLKDVPYMMSLVIISALILKILVEKKFSIPTAISIGAVCLVALFSRHNGLLAIPFTLVFLSLYFLISKKRGFALKSFIVTVAVLIAFFGTNNIIISSLGNRYWQRSSTSDILMMPTAQLSYTVDKNYVNLTEEQKALAYKYLDVDYIFFQSQSIGNWDFNNRYLETLNMDTISVDKRGFISFYLEMLKSYPLDMIKEYEQITGIIWATPNYGYTLVKNAGIPSNYVDIGLKTQYPFPKIAEFFNRDFKILFWLRPALWLMLSLFLLFLSKSRHGAKSIIVILPMLSNTAGFLFGTPAQNVRYFYCNFSCFVIALLFAFMATVPTTRAKEENTND